MDSDEAFEAIRQSLMEIAKGYDKQTNLLRALVEHLDMMDSRLHTIECKMLDTENNGD